MLVFSEILSKEINSNNKNNSNYFAQSQGRGQGGCRRQQDTAAPCSGAGATWQESTGVGLCWEAAPRPRHMQNICSSLLLGKPTCLINTRCMHTLSIHLYSSEFTKAFLSHPLGCLPETLSCRFLYRLSPH